MEHDQRDCKTEGRCLMIHNMENCMEAAPRVSIIILNWNGWKDTIECLESVYQITYPDYDVIVADNGSKNDSIDNIKKYAEGNLEVSSKFITYSGENKPLCCIEYSREEAEDGGGREGDIADFPSWKKLILIKNGENYGFAEGNNIAIRYALKVLKPEYVLLLNNDTVVEGAFLDELVTVAESDKKIGFVGPKTYYYDYYGRNDVINFAGGRLELWKGESAHIGLNDTDQGQYERVTDVDYVEGSCLLARRDTLETIGLLDPIYFLYWEDTDWCMRVHKAGLRLLYAPKAKIWHKVSASNRGTSNLYYLTRNKFYFIKRSGTSLQYILYLMYFFGYQFWHVSAYSLFYRRDSKMWFSFLRGFTAFLQNRTGK